MVNGAGNLSAGQYVNQVYLNFNPAKDLSKLQLAWSDNFGFPVPGANFGSFSAKQDGFALGNAGKFDILISFNANELGPGAAPSSKLIFSYNGAPGSDENLDLSDFNFVSTGGYVTAGTVWGTTPGGIAVIGAVPEPGTYAMLGLGLLGLGFAVRRRQR